MVILTELANNMLVEQMIPKYLPLIMKDLVSFKLGLHTCRLEQTGQEDRSGGRFLKVPYQN